MVTRNDVFSVSKGVSEGVSKGSIAGAISQSPSVFAGFAGVCAGVENTVSVI